MDWLCNKSLSRIQLLAIGLEAMNLYFARYFRCSFANPPDNFRFREDYS